MRFSSLLMMTMASPGTDLFGAERPLTLVAQYRCRTGGVMWMETNAKGTEIVIASTTHALELLSVPELHLNKTLKASAMSADFLPDGERILAGPDRRASETSKPLTMPIVKRDTDEVVASIPGELGMVDQRHNRIVFSSGGPTISIYDVATGQVTHQHKFPKGTAYPLAISESGAIGLYPGNYPSVAVWFPPFDKPPMEFRAHCGVTRMAIAPDGKMAALGLEENYVEIWNLGTKTAIRKLEPHWPGAKREVCDVRYSPDGKFLGSLGNGGEMIVWSTKDFAEIARFRAHESWEAILTFLPDNKHIVTAGSVDGLVKLWKIPD